jgi:4-nitrophenyl phosphatase
MRQLPSPLRLVIFDLDGVIYRGLEPLPGAVELVNRLHAAGVLIRFATNNSMASRAAYVERLAAMGIRAVADEIVTSTSATIEYLARHEPGVRRVLAVGESGMVDEMRGAGYAVTPAAMAAPPLYEGAPLDARYDAVIAGLDRGFEYPRLAAAASAILAGARFIATNIDARYPTPVGFLPGAGSIVAAIAAASGVEPLVIGKPGPAMFLAILEAAGVPSAQAAVVGDNPDADIVAARRAGIFSVLVLTGVADSETVPALDGERRPDLVLADADALAALLAEPVS